MFNFFKKKPPTGTQLTFKIDGMHCVACSLSIDDALEEIPGVIDSQTSYPQSTTTVTIDPTEISSKQILAAIKQTGYSASLHKS